MKITMKKLVALMLLANTCMVYAGGINSIPEPMSNIDALTHAAYQGNLESTKAILDSGVVDINAQNNRGWTALMSAVLGDHLELVGFLIDRGANIDLQNETTSHYNGWTALICAKNKMRPNPDMINLLINRRYLNTCKHLNTHA